MKTSPGRSFVWIMIVIAVASLLLRVAIEKLMIFNIAQNEINAQNNLKLISTALENYAKAHKGIFPDDFSLLTKSTPQLLDNNYLALSPIKGYNYSCSRLDASSYACSAMPDKCRLTANTIYSVSTGGLFVSEACSKQE
jgi:type II secretory pathway pseudopilin PulG